MFLSPREMRKVLHGDRVMARACGVDRRGRPKARSSKSSRARNARLVGRLHGASTACAFWSPPNRRISQDILIAPGRRGRGEAGQVVTVELVAQPATSTRSRCGRIVEVLGNYADPGMEIEIALRKHELPYEFSARPKRLAQKLPDEVRAADHEGREDLRDAAAGHHRRRDGEGFRRRGVLRGATGKGFQPAGWRSPTSAITCAPAMRWTSMRANAATRCISRAA